MRRTLVAMSSLAGLAIAGAPSLLHAQPTRPAPELVDITLDHTIKPARGFIDDPFAFDSTGSRLAYINADVGFAELRVIDLAQGSAGVLAPLAKIDLGKFTTTPVRLAFLPDGYFLVARMEGEAGQRKAAVMDAKGTVKHTFGPADDIVLTTAGGQPAVVTYTAAKPKPRRGQTAQEIHHTVNIHDLAGRRQGKPRILVTNDQGKSDKLDFRVVYFADGYLRAAGIKGGSWDAKQNQRSPDHEAWYDMLTGTFSKRIDITDVMEHAQRMKLMAEHSNDIPFLAPARDLSQLHLVTDTGSQPVALAQPFQHYDASSLEYTAPAGGAMHFAIQIDPVHREAVASKKAAHQYLDLYEYRLGEQEAKRRGRILLKSKRKMTWRAASGYWVVVPRLLGFDRGGTELQVYKLK